MMRRIRPVLLVLISALVLSMSAVLSAAPSPALAQDAGTPTASQDPCEQTATFHDGVLTIGQFITERVMADKLPDAPCMNAQAEIVGKVQNNRCVLLADLQPTQQPAPTPPHYRLPCLGPNGEQWEIYPDGECRGW